MSSQEAEESRVGGIRLLLVVAEEEAVARLREVARGGVQHDPPLPSPAQTVQGELQAHALDDRDGRYLSKSLQAIDLRTAVQGERGGARECSDVFEQRTARDSHMSDPSQTFGIRKHQTLDDHHSLDVLQGREVSEAPAVAQGQRLDAMGADEVETAQLR